MVQSKTLAQIFFLLNLISVFAIAEAPKVGKKAAAKYFQVAGNQTEQVADSSILGRKPAALETLGSNDHYMTLNLGKTTSSDSYNWGMSSKESDIGGFVADITYRLTQDEALYDQGIRLSYSEYSPAGQKAQKISFMYAMIMPDAGSQFPIYFGAAVGPGVFMRQLSGESSVTFDYQLLLGLRLFNIFEKTGFSVEGGLRNHLHLTSDGQLNSVFVSAGAVFTF